MKQKTGVLLLNLGTPRDPSPASVGAYLKEFLMDPFVVDIPYLFRWILVNWLIVPRRSHASGLLYGTIWTERGSPLLFHLQELTRKVQAELGENFPVRASMRYGEPSIKSALLELKAQGLDRLIVVPLYPQYSLAATESSIQAVKAMAREIDLAVVPEFIPAFYDRAEFLDAYSEVMRRELARQPYDFVLFSFHGLPERQVKRTDPTGMHCLQMEGCCDRIQEANRNCYRAQCYSTARSLAQRLGLATDQYQVCFQSRLGRTPWIRPYTDELYETLPARGKKRLAVACPAFVADCLETLEEVAIRGRKQFLAAGGEDLRLVPSLNSEESWVRTIADWVRIDFKGKSE